MMDTVLHKHCTHSTQESKK